MTNNELEKILNDNDAVISKSKINGVIAIIIALKSEFEGLNQEFLKTKTLVKNLIETLDYVDHGVYEDHLHELREITSVIPPPA